MKIGHTMPELQPFTFHEKFVAHPVYGTDTFWAVTSEVEKHQNFGYRMADTFKPILMYSRA